MKLGQWIVTGAVASVLVFLATVASFPPTYSSSATVSIRQLPGGANVVAKQAALQLTQSAFTNEWAAEVIQNLHLYEEEMEAGKKDTAIRAFYQDLKVQTITRSDETAVWIRYTGAKPLLSNQVSRLAMDRIMKQDFQETGASDSRVEIIDSPSYPPFPDQWLNYKSPFALIGLIGFVLGMASLPFAQLAWRRLGTAR